MTPDAIAAHADRSRATSLVAVLALGAAVAVVIGAAWAWGGATAALGERPFAPTRTWAARSAAAALWALAHAVLFGAALPALYRPRPAYAAVAATGAAAFVLAGVTAAALFAAAR